MRDKPLFTQPVNAKELLRTYRENECALSERQLWDWERLGIVRPQKTSPKKKLYSPDEAHWVGLALMLRGAGKGLEELKAVREALDSCKTQKQSRSLVLDMIELLQKQVEAMTFLQQIFQNRVHMIYRDTDGKLVIGKGKVEDKLEFQPSLQASIEKIAHKNRVKCNIAAIRNRHGVSQLVLSKALGMSQGRLSQIEQGWIKPTEDEKNGIAKFLKSKVEELFPK